MSRKTSKKTVWTKLAGAGNSFFMAYFPKPVQKNWSQISQKLCKKGAKADGLIVLTPGHQKTYDFKWIFRNADGSSAKMCGNGACAVAFYIFKKRLWPKKKPFMLKTGAGAFKCTFQKGKPEVCFKTSKISGPFSKPKINIHYMFVSGLVPHAVIKQNSLNTKNLQERKRLAKYLRKQTLHSKKGMNVSFYCPTKKKNTIKACSFERGLEDFTLACGTGALATAQVHQQSLKRKLKTIYVEMPGGKLKTVFHKNNKISLMSPVEI